MQDLYHQQYDFYSDSYRKRGVYRVEMKQAGIGNGHSDGNSSRPDSRLNTTVINPENE